MRLRDRIAESFALKAMPGAQQAGCTIRFIATNDLPALASTSRVVLAGSSQFILKWLCELDGLVDKIFLCPRKADRALQVSMLSQADCLIYEDKSADDWGWTSTSLKLAKQLDPGWSLKSSGIALVDSDPVSSQWVLATSGTSGQPKLISRELEDLARSVKCGASYAAMRWGLVFDVARFAGLQVFLQAAVSGATLLATDPEQSLEKQLNWLADQRCNALSATPTMWRKILMTSGVKHLDLMQVTLGGEIADQRVLDSLEQHFGSARITHVYASTEAGVGFAVHDRKAGFPADWLDDSTRDVRLKVDSDGTLWVECSDPIACHLSVNPEKQTSVSECDPPSAGQSATRTGSEIHRVNPDLLRVRTGASSLATALSRRDCQLQGSSVGPQWVNTGDKVEIRGDRVFFVGRIDGSINVGGDKVFPEVVESIIREVAGVEAVVVRGKPSSIVGNLVEARVKPSLMHADPNELVETIREHCRAHSPKLQVPAFIHVVDQIDISPTGKIDRRVHK